MAISKKYTNYLESLGFNKASKEEIEKYVPYEFEYIYDAAWYIFDGNLEIEDLKMDNLPLIVTGDLKVTKSTVSTVDYNGLVVLGKTYAKNLSLNGNTYLEDVIFEDTLMTTGNGAPRIINKATGAFLYKCSDSACIENVDNVKIYVDRDEFETLINFSNNVKNPEKYMEEFNDWTLSKEEFESNKDEIQDSYDSYIEYLMGEVGINSDEIKDAISANTFELITD